MGLYNIIKQKRGDKEPQEIPNGEQVRAETEEDFMDFCRSVTKDFKGVMILYNEGGKPSTAAILLEDGNIIGASFEDTVSNEPILREEAVGQVKKELSGTAGDLKVYSFSAQGMETVKKDNTDILLKTAIPFASLGMKIKANVGSGQKKGEGASPLEKENIKELEVDEDFDLLSFARKFSLGLPARDHGEMRGTSRLTEKDIPKPEEEMLAPHSEGPQDKKLLGVGLDLKRERFAEIKKKRQMEDMALMKRISQITGKKPESAVTEVSKVETSIDKLYQMVQKYKRLRIDNELAQKLGVSRTQIESWAMILEEHNLVDLHYPAIGEPEIRKMGEK